MSITIKGNVLHQFLVNRLHLEIFSFDLHLLAEVLLNDGLQLSCVFFVQSARGSVMLGVEVVECVENDVKLLGYSELVPTSYWHFLGIRRIRVPQTLLQIEALDLEWHFDLIGNSTSKIGTKLSGISNGEAMWRLDVDLKLFSVDLSHSLNFSEGNGVSIVETMFLLLVQTNQALLFLSNASNVNGPGLFTIRIEDPMRLSEIDEGIAIQSEVACQDEP